MRKILLLSALLVAVACDSSDARFSLEGAIRNAQEGEMICLSYPVKRDGIWREQIDTAYVEGGKFSFEGDVSDVVPAYISFENMDGARIYIEPARIAFSAERNMLYDYELRGLSVDDELRAYNDAFGGYNKAIYEILSRAQQKNQEWAKAYDAGMENVDELWAEFYAIVVEHHAMAAEWPAMAREFIAAHPDFEIVPNLIAEMTLDGSDVAVEQLYANLTAAQRESAMGELLSIRREIAQLRGGEVGSRALNFALEAIDGGVVRLSECYADGYVLLDFWASWCRPCIAEIPAVRDLHKKYGDVLQILSISVDEDKTQWHEAVAQHNLSEWPQLRAKLSDDVDSYYFREQADISLAYGVELIPCFLLVDRQGVIVGRWSHLTDDAVDEIVAILQRDDLV